MKILLSFLIIGILNTVLGFLIIFLLIYLGVNVYISNFFGYFFGFLLGFVLNKKLTFNNQGGFGTTLLKYFILFIISYLLSLIILHASLLYLPKQINWMAHYISFPVYFICNYLGCRFFVFYANK